MLKGFLWHLKAKVRNAEIAVEVLLILFGGA